MIRNVGEESLSFGAQTLADWQGSVKLLSDVLDFLNDVNDVGRVGLYVVD